MKKNIRFTCSTQSLLVTLLIFFEAVLFKKVGHMNYAVGHVNSAVEHVNSTVGQVQSQWSM